MDDEFRNQNPSSFELTDVRLISDDFPADEEYPHEIPALSRNESLTEIPRLYESIKQQEQIKVNENIAREEKGEKKQKVVHGKVDRHEKIPLPLKRKSRKKKKKSEPPAKRMLIDDHTLPVKELAEKFNTQINFEDPKESHGLSTEEAQKRLLENGPNSLTPVQVTPMWVKFLKQFVAFFPLLLESGGTLCLVAYGLDDSTSDNLYLGIILWLVVIITAIFSFMQEAKSASVMEGFKKLAPQNCKVHRDGKVREINAVGLVVGDIVEIKAGDKIPADLCLLWVQSLKVDNSSLTGENEPQARSTECTDENPLETRNLAFFGTLVQEGSALGLVIRTGDNTVIGNIAGLAQGSKSEETPLHREISRFIKIVSVVAITLGTIFFIVGKIVGMDWIPVVVFVIGIIVANVPEGLLPTVTVALTLTAKKLASKNVLVKKLEAVETLGSCSTICSDKTGTLTQNRMTVVHMFYDGLIWTVDDITSKGAYSKDSPSFVALRRIAALCNRAVFDSDPENMAKEVLKRRTVGDASESALIKFVEPLCSVDKYRAANPKLFEIPFNSVNKWQLSIHRTDVGGMVLVMKGAPERVIARCTNILMEGEVVPMAQEHPDAFQNAYETLAGHGERVLGFAQLELNPKDFPEGYEFDPEKQNFPTEGLTFVGLMALQDPPRPNVPEAVAKCKQAGIRVIMVTGDHHLTAAAIAKQVGIIEGDTPEDVAKREGIPVSQVDKGNCPAIIVRGSELEGLTEQDWENILSKRQIVFARTSPEQKLEIVEHFQAKGEIVAVTGDGVNDSPALKKADLGCAMGITGSDVATDAADIILLDDNFASIVTGIEEGRIIFDNLKKSICYTLSSNSAELMPFVLFAVLQMPLALSAVLILCIDLGTDMVPAISLAYERPESDIMKRKPRDPKRDRLVTLRLAVWSYLWLGSWQAIAGFIAYLVTFSDYGIAPSDLVGVAIDHFKQGANSFEGYNAQEQLNIQAEAQTAFFVAVVMTRMGVVISSKTRKVSLFKQSILSNKVLNFGLLIEIALVVTLTYVPIFNVVFGTRVTSWKPWVIGLPFAIFLMFADETRKFLIRRYPRSRFARYTFW